MIMMLDWLGVITKKICNTHTVSTWLNLVGLLAFILYITTFGQVVHTRFCDWVVKI